MRNKIILAAVLVASLFTAPVAMAGEYNECHGTVGCTAHVTGKVIKRVVSVPGIVIRGAVDAGKTYMDGGDTVEVIVAGVAGAGEQAAEAISDAATDAATVAKVGLKAAGSAFIWGIGKLAQ